jgi:hypothetical protein
MRYLVQPPQGKMEEENHGRTRKRRYSRRGKIEVSAKAPPKLKIITIDLLSEELGRDRIMEENPTEIENYYNLSN